MPTATNLNFPKRFNKQIRAHNSSNFKQRFKAKIVLRTCFYFVHELWSTTIYEQRAVGMYITKLKQLQNLDDCIQLVATHY